MPFAFYNDTDEYCCTWLENLISARIIPYGVVDPTPIQKLKPSTLAKFTQVHLFAGMGGWAYALRLAGWPDAKPVWTGSCPCQPFSNIGQRRGFKDSRHLWPYESKLIAQCRPPVIFGEQIAGATVWLDTVFSDLETHGYACGAANLPSASVGTQHIRQRLWFVADANQARWTNVKRQSAPQEKADFRPATRVVPSQKIEHLPGPSQPDPSWITDGLSGEGFAVGAYGNSIVPQLAAEFITACADLLL